MAQVLCAQPRRPRTRSPDALSPPAPRRGFSFVRHARPAPPKIAVPTRTWVAPNAIAVAKSALIPIESSLRPLRAAILAVSAKCGAGASSNGGMHIRPAISRPCVSRQVRMNASASCGSTPAFCGSAPVLISTNSCGCAPLSARSPSPAPRRCSAGRPNGSRRTARPPPWPCWTASGPIRCSSSPGWRVAQRRPFRLCLLHAVLAEHALARRDHRLDRFRAECLRHRDQRDRIRRPAGRLAGRRDLGLHLRELFVRASVISLHRSSLTPALIQSQCAHSTLAHRAGRIHRPRAKLIFNRSLLRPARESP